MQVIWNSDNPITGREIIELSGNSTWAHSTIYMKLNRLVEKNMIKEFGAIKIGKNINRLYIANIKPEEYFKFIIDNMPPCMEIQKVISMLLSKNDIKPETIDELLLILKKYKK